MIDLNKKQSEVEISTTEKKLNKAQEAAAKKFLCIAIAMILVFLGVICIFVSKRNKTLLAQQKIDEVTKNNPTKAVTTPGSSVNEVTPDTSKPAEEVSAHVDVDVPDKGTVDDPKIITIDEEKWYLTLLGVGYKLPEDYEPDLVYVCDSQERLNIKVAESYEKMYKAAQKENLLLTPCSGYRSTETQDRNFKRKVDFYISQGFDDATAKAKAIESTMPGGSSEHNMGIAIDIVCVENWFEETEEFKWLDKNAADYGFVLRYPNNKQSITNSAYEPWHWRYVGVEAAKQMKAKGLTLEEYLGVTQ